MYTHRQLQKIKEITVYRYMFSNQLAHYLFIITSLVKVELFDLICQFTLL